MTKQAPLTREQVFVVGGQPSITYVDRAHLGIEKSFSQALRIPGQIVSLAGPSKTGKTVLCKKVLGDRPHVWIEGGQIQSIDDIWNKVCYKLNYPIEIVKALKDEEKGGFKFGLKVIDFDGSVLKGDETRRTYKIDSMTSALLHLKEKAISIVIDDFHYIPQETRVTFLRNVKGSVFDGLKVVLLSVTHRGLDAIKDEPELQGRVSSVLSPDWEASDLSEIPALGFRALNISCAESIANRLSEEAQSNPFLMQKLCYEICAGLGIDSFPENTVAIPDSYDLLPIFKRLSADFGQPIYRKLEAGPQTRRKRQDRPLKSGHGTADIYKAILMAIASTGPKATLTYEELRDKLDSLLGENAPQKNETTSALKHLSVISQKSGNDSGIDWNSDERRIDISDPYLRFYLRWQIRPTITTKPQFDPSLFKSIRFKFSGGKMIEAVILNKGISIAGKGVFRDDDKDD